MDVGARILKVNKVVNRLIALHVKKEKLVIDRDEEALLRWYVKGKFRSTTSDARKCAALEKKWRAHFRSHLE